MDAAESRWRTQDFIYESIRKSNNCSKESIRRRSDGKQSPSTDKQSPRCVNRRIGRASLLSPVSPVVNERLARLLGRSRSRASPDKLARERLIASGNRKITEQKSMLASLWLAQEIDFSLSIPGNSLVSNHSTCPVVLSPNDASLRLVFGQVLEARGR
jgi:hypothetical protein